MRETQRSAVGSAVQRYQSSQAFQLCRIGRTAIPHLAIQILIDDNRGNGGIKKDRLWRNVKMGEKLERLVFAHGGNC
ncbi:MAG: hypothetical protein R2932_23700 [Caldilineaceae bacterium]